MQLALSHPLNMFACCTTGGTAPIRVGGNLAAEGGRQRMPAPVFYEQVRTTLCADMPGSSRSACS